MVREAFSTTIHIGSFKDKELKDSVRWTIRAAMASERKRLGRAAFKRKGEETVLEGRGIVLSLSHNGWVHFATDVCPYSTAKLLLANTIHNRIASYLNISLKGQSKVGQTSNILAEIPLRPSRISKFFVNTYIDRLTKSLGFDLTPSGMFLVSKDGPSKKMVATTLYENKCSVQTIFYNPLGDQIPKDCLRDSYKVASALMRNTLPILQAN